MIKAVAQRYFRSLYQRTMAEAYAAILILACIASNFGGVLTVEYGLAGQSGNC
jgi:hypothetical protein